jgi:hypothetical protein
VGHARTQKCSTAGSASVTAVPIVVQTSLVGRAASTMVRKYGASRRTSGSGRSTIEIDTAFRGLGDRLVALCATRMLAKEMPQFKFVFVPGSPDLVNAYGDGLVEAYNPERPARNSIRVSLNPDRLHRRKWGSDSINYLGSYLMEAAGPQMVQDRWTPRPELPPVPKMDHFRFVYAVIQPESTFAQPQLPTDVMQALVDACPMPVYCVGADAPRTLKHVNYDYLGDEVRMLQMIRHASLVLTPRSASVHIAAGYNVPTVCWVPDDGENWHLDYQDEWNRVLLPVSDPDHVKKAGVVWIRNNMPVTRRPVLCVNQMRTENTGDLNASPALWFNLGASSFSRLTSPRPLMTVMNEVVVIGGGGLLYYPHVEKILERDCRKTVIWAVGVNRHIGLKDSFEDRPPEIFKKASLCGIRDFITGWRWVPCPSCMSPLFDVYGRTEPKHEVVIYSHMDHPISSTEFPSMINRGGSMEDAIRFLASGDVVVTNSYHGVYWATLLGRRVICYEPFSTRFWYFRHPPHLYCDRNDWRRGWRMAKGAGRWSGALEECRKANREFYADVLDLINA